MIAVNQDRASNDSSQPRQSFQWLQSTKTELAMIAVNQDRASNDSSQPRQS